MAFATDHDQAKTRAHYEYTDQHGRPWSCVIDLKSQAPIGAPGARFPAPLMPPTKYVRVQGGQFGRLVIDYDGWVQDLRDAHTAYNAELLRNANELYGDRAANAMEERPPALIHRVGPPPEPLEPVLAAKAAGDHPTDPKLMWILGMPVGQWSYEPRPEWAWPFFPPDAPKRKRAVVEADDLAFLNAGEHADDEDEDTSAGGFDAYNALIDRARELGVEFTGRPKKTWLERAIREVEQRDPDEDIAGRHPSWTES